MNLSSWDFTSQHKQNQQSTPKLLPPSVFEKTINLTTTTVTSGSNEATLNQSTTTSIEPSETVGQFKYLIGELDRFKYEINKLKNENDILRSKNRNFIEQAQLYNETNVHFQQQQQQNLHNHCQISISTLEDIIHKQSNEIEQLKADKQDGLKRLNDYETHLNAMKATEESLKAKLNEKADNEVKFKNELALLATQIQHVKSTNERLQTDLNTYKSYADIDYIDKLKAEACSADANHKVEINRNKQLHNENDLLKIRLKSIEDILNMQEKQLDSTTTSRNMTNSQKRSGLLTKWRLKVFELLVQSRTNQIEYTADLNKTEMNIKDLEKRFDNLKQQKTIVDSLMEDKKAQIAYEKNENKKLNEAIKKLNTENVDLNGTKQAYIETQKNLNNFTHVLLNNYKYIENSFEVINKKLLNFDKRIEYSKSRVDIIKTLNTHKDNKFKNEIKRLVDLSAIHKPNSNSTAIEHDIDEKKEFKNQLDQVMQERNILATKLQDDMNSMNERLNQMKSEYEMTIGKLNRQVNEYDMECKRKDAELVTLKSEYVQKTQLIGALNMKLDDLNKKINDMQKTFEVEYDRQLSLKEKLYEEKMQQIEVKLNESRREQAKALVLMRQMERNVKRDKERSDALNKEMEVFYKTSLDKLQIKIISLEKERNILSQTIRQNGIHVNRHETDVLAVAMAHASKQISTNTSFATQYNNNNNNNNTMNVDDGITNNGLELAPDVDDDEHEHDNTSVWLETASGSTSANNNEILVQIRKIMGNLELSDIDDDDDDEEDDNERVSNDNEHAIDDAEITI